MGKIPYFANIFGALCASGRMFALCVTLRARKPTPKSSEMCTTLGYINMMAFVCSVESLGVISVNRYVKICHPSLFVDIYSVRSVLFMAAGVWLISGIMSLPPLFGWARYSYLPLASICFCDWPNSPSYAYFMIACCFCVPCGVMTMCYVYILRAYRQSNKTIQAFSQPAGSSLENEACETVGGGARVYNVAASGSIGNAKAGVIDLEYSKSDADISTSTATDCSHKAEQIKTIAIASDMTNAGDFGLCDTKTRRKATSFIKSINDETSLSKCVYGTKDAKPVISNVNQINEINHRVAHDAFVSSEIDERSSLKPDVSNSSLIDTDVLASANRDTDDFKTGDVESNIHQNQAIPCVVSTALACNANVIATSSNCVRGINEFFINPKNNNLSQETYISIANGENVYIPSKGVEDYVGYETGISNGKDVCLPSQQANAVVNETQYGLSSVFREKNCNEACRGNSSCNGQTNVLVKEFATKNFMTEDSSSSKVAFGRNSITPLHNSSFSQRARRKPFFMFPKNQKFRSQTQKFFVSNPLSPIEEDTIPQFKSEKSKFIYNKHISFNTSLDNVSTASKKLNFIIPHQSNFNGASCKKQFNTNRPLPSCDPGFFNILFKSQKLKSCKTNPVTNSVSTESIGYTRNKKEFQLRSPLVAASKTSVSSVFSALDENRNFSPNGCDQTKSEIEILAPRTLNKTYNSKRTNSNSASRSQASRIQVLSVNPTDPSTAESYKKISDEGERKKDIDKYLTVPKSASSNSHSEEIPKHQSHLFSLPIKVSHEELPTQPQKNKLTRLFLIPNSDRRGSLSESSVSATCNKQPKTRSSKEKASERRRRDEIRLTTSLLVVVALFIVCWFPYCISMFISIFRPELSGRGLDMTSLMLGYMNSCVNPIVYGLMNRRFKEGYKKLFTKCRFC